MTHDNSQPNRVKAYREQQNWSQAELATRAGIARPSVSAIESGRLSPSVATALELARTFDCTVEDLFGQASTTEATPRWAWQPIRIPWRYWQAEVAGRRVLIPVESATQTTLPHDGHGDVDDAVSHNSHRASQTLVLASCDPAAELLAGEYHRRTGMRLVVVMRSSRHALELLQQGAVHLAGVHFSATGQSSGNRELVAGLLGHGYSLIRGAEWDAGVALGTGVTARSIKGITQAGVRWIGREPGSGARRVLDELLPARHRYQHVARNHRGVVEAIAAGWADAGVCVRLVSDELGLRFLCLHQESYDLCFPTASRQDPRIKALVAVLQSTGYRQLIGELPGYNSRETGSESTVTVD